MKAKPEWDTPRGAIANIAVQSKFDKPYPFVSEVSTPFISWISSLTFESTLKDDLQSPLVLKFYNLLS